MKTPGQIAYEAEQKLANPNRERMLRAALMEFVRVERMFGHNGQHKSDECADCKRIKMANNALSHGYLEHRPKIVCLCGSMRFYKAFRKAEYNCELSGEIALLPAFSPNLEVHEHGGNADITPIQKSECDALHRHKIDLSDEVLVINVGGYVGESTQGEIEYAIATGKTVRYLESAAQAVIEAQKKEGGK